MKIKLVQTGGLIGLTRSSVADWPLSDTEFNNICKKMTDSDSSVSRKQKDAFSYYLSREKGKKLYRISIMKIPEDYYDLFERLLNGLAVEK